MKSFTKSAVLLPAVLILSLGTFDASASQHDSSNTAVEKISKFIDEENRICDYFPICRPPGNDSSSKTNSEENNVI